MPPKAAASQKRDKDATPSHRSRNVNVEASLAASANGDSPKELDELREKLAAERENISLFTRPLTTISLFSQYVVGFASSKLVGLLTHPALWLLVVPGIAGWIALKHVLAPHLFAPPVCGDKDGALLWQVEFAVVESFWWIILGVLSSIGFGTGLHSGLMFLFPHIMQVVGAAEACKTTSGLVGWYQHPCKFDCSTTHGPKDDSTVTFLNLWLLCTVPCMLWGIGTAIGEIPPYAVAKTARLSGTTDSEFQAEIDDAKNKTDLFSKMKIWTISFTEKHGFFGVFLLAAWPNAAFDMCGMCCGYLLMPFWTFFLATALGKGVVKVNLQAVVFVNLFGSWFFSVLASAIDSLNTSLKGFIGKDFALKDLVVSGRQKLLSQFELQSRISPKKLFAGAERGSLGLGDLQRHYQKYEGGDQIAARVLAHWDADGNGSLSLAEIGEAASRTDGMVSLGALDPGAGQSLPKMLWELFIVGLVCFFVVSIVHQLARLKQQEADEAAIEDLEKKQKGKKEDKKAR